MQLTLSIFYNFRRTEIYSRKYVTKSNTKTTTIPEIGVKRGDTAKVRTLAKLFKNVKDTVSFCFNS